MESAKNTKLGDWAPVTAALYLGDSLNDFAYRGFSLHPDCKSFLTSVLRVKTQIYLENFDSGFRWLGSENPLPHGAASREESIRVRCRLMGSENRCLVSAVWLNLCVCETRPQVGMPTDAYKKNAVIKSFLTDPSKPEIDIEVKNVALGGMQALPYKARVDFCMVYCSPPDHSELKRTLYTANFLFVFKTNLPNQLIPINPLGLAITYLREDEAFK